MAEREHNGHAELKPITVIMRYEDEENGPDARYAGFLTSPEHAMYVETESGLLFFFRVEPTNDASAYVAVSGFTVFGLVEDPEKDAATIAVLTETLKDMTAYDFMAKVIVNVRAEIDFEELIIPNLIPGVN